MLLPSCHKVGSDLWLQSLRIVSLGWQLAGPAAELHGFAVLVTTAGTADGPLASSLVLKVHERPVDRFCPQPIVQTGDGAHLTRRGRRAAWSVWGRQESDHLGRAVS